MTSQEPHRACAKWVLFGDLDADQFDSVVQHAGRLTLQENEVLFEQQQPARETILLES